MCVFNRDDKIEEKCEQCGDIFIKQTYHQKFCFDPCRTKFHNEEKKKLYQEAKRARAKKAKARK